MSNITDLWLSGVFFQALNTPKCVFGRGSTPDSAGGAYDDPLLINFPPRRLRCLDLDLGAFGASVVSPPT